MPDMDNSKPARPARRRFLLGAGALVVVVAGGVVYRGIDRGAFGVSRGPAYQPWTDWNAAARTGTPLALLAAGILAANPHNTQPWIFRVGDDLIELYADRSRNLGSFDPYLREMYLGLGCAIENMILAGPPNGFLVGLDPAPGSLNANYDPAEPALAARLYLSPAKTPVTDELYPAIAMRRTNRGPYRRGRALDRVDMDALRIFGGGYRQKIYLYTDGEQRELFDRTTIQATEHIIADEEMARASASWFRFTREAVARHRDGITYEALGLSPLVLALGKMLPPPSAREADKVWLQATRDVHLATAPVTGYIAVRDLYDIPLTLDTGRLWQRIHLWAETRGIAMHPINQSVEMVDRDRQLGRPPDTEQTLAHLTGDPDWKPTFAFRAGYPRRKALPSPRRAVTAAVGV